MTAPRIRFYTPFAQKTGYSEAGHNYLMALLAAGCEIDIRVLGDGADTDNLDAKFAVLAQHASELLPADDPRQADDWPTHVVVHTIPKWAYQFVITDLAPAPGVEKVCLTTWETDRLPPEDAQSLTEHFDLIVVPTAFNAEVFHKAGVPYEKLRTIPHCFDLSFWDQPYAQRPKLEEEKSFAFYNIGVWAERKNPIGLLKAYLTEFTDADDVVLRLVTPAKETMRSDVAALGRSLALHHLPKVEFFTDRLSAEELFKLHMLSNCYVTLTRAEGWGLGAFEAALAGNYVLATGWSGHLHWMDSYSNSARVKYMLTPAISPEQILTEAIKIGGLTITPVGRIAPAGIAADQCWAEPDLMHARCLMRSVYVNRLGRRSTGSDRPDLSWAKQYTYERVGKMFRQELLAIGRKKAFCEFPDAPRS